MRYFHHHYFYLANVVNSYRKESKLDDQFPEKNFLTSQVISDIKDFINILNSTVVDFYEPVIKMDSTNTSKCKLNCSF